MLDINIFLLWLEKETFRLINEATTKWGLLLFFPFIFAFPEQLLRMWLCIPIPGSNAENLLVVQVNKIFNIQRSATSHPIYKYRGGWKGKSQQHCFCNLPSSRSITVSVLTSISSFNSKIPPLCILYFHTCRETSHKEGKRTEMLCLKKMHKCETAGTSGKSNQVSTPKSGWF